MKKTLITTFVAIAAGISAPGFAAGDDADHTAVQAQVPGDTQMVEGLVKKVDKSAGKATLSHGPLPNLGMPAMTMVFRVKDLAWLDQMKEGDKIKFTADRVNGAFTVVQFKVAM